MEPRHQMNLQGLLKFALQQTKAEDADAANTSIYQEMDDERKGFLESAMRTMSVDIIKEFEKAISVLENPTALTLDKMTALNIIREHVDNIDFANSFVKVGGTRILLEYLKSEESQLRVNAMYIIAEMSQNNPFCQQHFVEAKVIPVLVPYLSENEDVARSSALHAVSSLVRNFEPGLIEFLQIGGIHAILSCLSTTYTRVFVKACFVIATLSLEYPTVRDEFVKKSAVESLSSYVECVSGFDIKIETVLFALSELSKSPHWKPALELRENLALDLNNIIDLNKNLPQCEEMLTYANVILVNLKDESCHE